MGLLLALVHDLESMIWFATLIYGHYLGRWLNSPRVERIIDRVTASILVAFGIVVASESRFSPTSIRCGGRNRRLWREILSEGRSCGSARLSASPTRPNTWWWMAAGR